jgi:hypothetical protein
VNRPDAPLSLTEAKELIRLCETGRLYEVEPRRGGRSVEAHNVRAKQA